MDTKLGPRHLTKDMQNLLLIIQDSVRFKKSYSNDILFLCKSEVEGEVVGLSYYGEELEDDDRNGIIIVLCINYNDFYFVGFLFYLFIYFYLNSI